MAVDLMRYDLLVQDALRGVVRKVLGDLARDGLVGDHHFYITFRTHARGVRLSSRMRELYPDEMTIILQHQFWDLSVNDHAFEVGLSFKNVPEMLLIPFDAITRFSDPAAGFDLEFKLDVEIGGGERERRRPAGPDGCGAVTPPRRRRCGEAERCGTRRRRGQDCLYRRFSQENLMGEIVNLRRARKQKARAGSEAEAAANRAKFGASRAGREAATSRRELEAARLDGHRLTPAAPDDADG